MNDLTASHASRLGRALATLIWLVGMLLVPLSATAAEAPTFAERLEGQHILDDARLISDAQEERLSEELQEFLAETGVDLVVYTRQLQPVGSLAEARDQATELVSAWQVGGENGLGAAMLWNVHPSGDPARVGVAAGSELALRLDGANGMITAVTQSVGPSLKSKEWDTAAANGIGVMTRRSNAALGNPRATPAPTAGTDVTPVPTPRPTRRPTTPGGRPDIGPAPPPGPPYPDPITDVRVYDYAEVLSDEVIEQVAATIDAIEQRTAAQIVVYTQMKPGSDTPEKAERDAAALIDQWGIGRKGFDDGLVILYDLSDPCHGQVQLYAAPGYAAAFLSNAERQEIFEQRMLPLLRGCDLDGAHDRGDGAHRRDRDRRPRARPPARPPGRRRGRARPRAVAAPRARRLGGLELAALRTRPRVPRRRLDPHAGPAARPLACSGRGHHRRARDAPRLHDRARGSRGPRGDRVPPARRDRRQARHRHHGPRPARYAPLAQPTHPARAGGDVPPRRAPTARREAAQDRRRRRAQGLTRDRRLRGAARGPGRRAAVVHASRPRMRSGAGRCAAASSSSSASRPRSSASSCPATGCCSSGSRSSWPRS